MGRVRVSGTVRAVALTLAGFGCVTAGVFLAFGLPCALIVGGVVLFVGGLTIDTGR